MTPPVGLDPAEWALFLDIDGTLLDLIDDPKAVRADPALLDLLLRLSALLGGALALVSGRDLADIDRIMAPLRLP
ncbi:MAG TPA: trehalose-phosphatase, partial [Azospirillaceae bacterium]|nr:trehalose-phosphatase [Azospirillaceae bacterium]